jgi:hypothetical protein
MISERIDGEWQEPIFITDLNNTAEEKDAYFTQDESRLYFSSFFDEPMGRCRTYYSDYTGGSWSEIVEFNVGFDMSYNVGNLTFRPDNKYLLFRAHGAGIPLNTEIWFAGMEDNGPGDPILLGRPVDSGNHEGDYRLSSDGRTVMFTAKNRPGGHGGWDIWQSTCDFDISDTDSDLMPDIWEDTYWCVDSAVADSSDNPDGDVLTNLEEYQNGTDPCVSTECSDGLDNDSDGFIDWPDDPECDSFSDDSEFNFAMSFDGVDDYVQISDSSDFYLNNTATIELWVKVNECEEVTLVGKHKIGDEDKTLWLNADCSFSSYFFNVMFPNRLGSPSPLALFTWVHLATVYDGSSVILYQNGENVASRNISGDVLDSNGFVNIARREWTFGAFDYFNGLIEEIRWWNVARTQQEIQDNMYQQLNGDEPGLMGYWNFNEGSGQEAFDGSGNGNDGMLGNSVDPDSADPVYVADTPF